MGAVWLLFGLYYLTTIFHDNNFYIELIKTEPNDFERIEALVRNYGIFNLILDFFLVFPWLLAIFIASLFKTLFITKER
jgi:hypothetical protein